MIGHLQFYFIYFGCIWELFGFVIQMIMIKYYKKEDQNNDEWTHKDLLLFIFFANQLEFRSFQW